MPPCRRTVALFIVVLGIVGGASGLGAQPGPTGEVVWAWHVTITPAWFDRSCGRDRVRDPGPGKLEQPARPGRPVLNRARPAHVALSTGGGGTATMGRT